MSTTTDGLRVEVLSSDELKELKKFMVEIPLTFSGAAGMSIDGKEVRLDHERYFDVTSPAINVFALFKNDKLVALAKTYKWMSLPYYSVNSFFIVAKSQVKFLTVLELMMKQITSFMESELRFTFFTAARLRPSYLAELKTKGDMIRVFRTLPAYQNYDFVTEEILKPGEISKVSSFRELLNNTIWDCPVIIRRATLKETVRSQLLLNRAGLN